MSTHYFCAGSPALLCLASPACAHCQWRNCFMKSVTVWGVEEGREEGRKEENDGGDNSQHKERRCTIFVKRAATMKTGHRVYWYVLALLWPMKLLWGFLHIYVCKGITNMYILHPVPDTGFVGDSDSYVEHQCREYPSQRLLSNLWRLSVWQSAHNTAGLWEIEHNAIDN